MSTLPGDAITPGPRYMVFGPMLDLPAPHIRAYPPGDRRRREARCDHRARHGEQPHEGLLRSLDAQPNDAVLAGPVAGSGAGHREASRHANTGIASHRSVRRLCRRWRQATAMGSVHPQDGRTRPVPNAQRGRDADPSLSRTCRSAIGSLGQRDMATRWSVGAERMRPTLERDPEASSSPHTCQN